MPIPMDRLILSPAVTALTGTFIINPSLEDALIQIGGEEIAEREGTPLNRLSGRVMASGENTGGNGDDIVEFAGRQCYRSWSKGREASEYIGNILAEAHGSVFEHSAVGFQITGVSRTFSHEQIRHSVGTGVSQESQRYVDAKDVKFVVPPLLANHIASMSESERSADLELLDFREACAFSLEKYASLQSRFNDRLRKMLAAGADDKAVTSAKKRANEAARSVLPNASETRLFYTTNLRALRHIIIQRASEHADLEIRRVAVELFRAAQSYAPLFFQDMEVRRGGDGLEIIAATWGRC